MSWRTVRLGELVDNFSVRAKDVGGADGLDFYGVSNDEGIIKTKYAAEDKAEDYKIIEKGCFAYNPYRVNVGSIGLVSDDTRGLISPAYVVFKPKPNAIIPELLFKFLKSDEGLRQIKFYARGTVRQALRFEDLCNIEITVPDFEEQQILYNKLNNSQEASNVLDTELKNQLELLKKLRQQLLQDAVQGKLFEQNPKDEPACQLLQKIKAEKEKLIAEKKLKKEKVLPPIKPEEIPFEIPENWVWCRFQEITKLITCGLASTPKYYSSGRIFLSAKNVKPLRFMPEEHKFVDEETYRKVTQNAKPELHDILVTRVGAGIGETAIIDKEIDFAFYVSLTLIKPFKGFIDPMFLTFFLNSPQGINNAVTFTTGVKSSQGNLNVDKVRKFLISLPPLAEQSRIVQKLDELMQYCNELEISIKQSESQNEKLLQQVLREALRKEQI
jgi:type I restriction enzyme, S subunit